MRETDIQKSWLNAQVQNSPADFVKQCEDAYHGRLSHIGDDILKTIEQKPIVLITGPSSSGKTTTAEKFQEYFTEKGVKTYLISMDDYYKTMGSYVVPKTETGENDLESPDCMDLDLLTSHLAMLARGEAIDVPTFDFQNRKRADETHQVQIKKGEAVIIEGIHALNDVLMGKTQEIAKRVYIRPEDAIYDGEDMVLGPHYTRLFRRCVRDKQFRATPLTKTLGMWNSIRRGEHLYIKPFKVNADYLMNTYLPYETSIFANLLQPVLENNRELLEEKGLAHLIEATRGFVSFDYLDYLPENSLLHEFLG